MRVIRLVPHDPAWKAAYEALSERIAVVLGENACRIYHIGSTAVPGIFAKPTIDILVEAFADQPRVTIRGKTELVQQLGARAAAWRREGV